MLLDDVNLQTSSGRTMVRLKCDQCDAEIKRDVGATRKSRALHGYDLCKRCVTINYNKSRPMEVRRRAGAASAAKCTGKKIEEIVGEERASRIRKTLSEQRTGEKNHNFGGRHQKFKIRTGTLEEQFGAEKASKIRSKMSLATSGEKNPMFGRPTPKKAGSGISGHYKTYYFRSLLELSTIIHLEAQGIEFIPCDGRSEFKFIYEMDGTTRTYYPDFYLTKTDEIIEVKPKRLVTVRQNTLKSEAVQRSGRKFKFVSEEEVPRIKKADLLEMINAGSVTIDQNKIRMLQL